MVPIVWILIIWTNVFMLNRWFSKRDTPLSQKSIMIVFGSGGHTTEMLLMLESLNVSAYRQVHLIIARSDTWSLTKITEHFRTAMKHPVDLSKLDSKSNITIWRVFRAREVKQSYITSVFTTLLALAQSFLITLYCKVDLVVSNGPGTALPIVFSNWLLSRFSGWKSQTLFIESFCRVTSLSLTGKLLLPICDK